MPIAALGKRLALRDFGSLDWRTFPTWANDPDYGKKWAARLNELAPVFSEGGPDMATHRYVLSAGHRNTDKGGAKNEINWTYGATKALQAAIIARGGHAWVIQEEDGDTDDTFCVGRGLQNAAWLCTELAKAVGGVDAYISMHYNGGAAPGFHAIFPDAWNGVDVKANNPLDVQLCRVIRDKVRATNTVKMLSWTADSPGVMSERETGVGAQGYRLGEFYGTIGFRDTTARVILEASSIDVASEARYINDPAWVRNVYAEAIVDGLEAVFGAFPATTPAPPDGPETPAEQYAAADPIAAVADAPLYVKLNNGAEMFRTDWIVRATKQTPRRKYATTDSASIGPEIGKGEQFGVDYLILNKDGSKYLYTPWHTRVAFDDVEIVGLDVGQDVA